jgi:small nuclear ribonucleoprotein (snRNP)-like protein
MHLRPNMKQKRLSHALTASLPHCLTHSLHCLTASLHHSLTASLTILTSLTILPPLTITLYHSITLSHYHSITSSLMPPPTSLPHSLTPSQTHSLLTQRRPTLHKSLALLLSSLVGTRLLVELKNSMELTGILEESDANMNMTLQQVSLTHSLPHFITHSNSLYPLQSIHSFTHSLTHSLLNHLHSLTTQSLTLTHSLTHSLGRCGRCSPRVGFASWMWCSSMAVT